DDPSDREDDERDDHVGEERERLGGEDLAAANGADEDRLQGAAAVLVCDDVAGDQGGDDRRAEVGDLLEHDWREREPTVAQPLAHRVGVGAVVGGDLRDLDRDQEDELDDRGRGQTDPAALLRDQLAQLPVVTPADGGEAVAERPGARRGEPARAVGLAAHAIAASASRRSASDSVSRKKRSSSVVCSRTSARIPTPVSASARVSSTVSSSPPSVKVSSSSSRRRPATASSGSSASTARAMSVACNR